MTAGSLVDVDPNPQRPVAAFLLAIALVTTVSIVLRACL